MDNGLTMDNGMLSNSEIISRIERISIMDNEKLLSTSEVISQIADILAETDTDFIESIANQVLYRKVRYLEDDMFEYVDSVEE